MNDIDLGAVRVGGEILFDLRLISDKRYVYSGFGNSLCCADNDLLRSTVSSHGIKNYIHIVKPQLPKNESFLSFRIV